MVTACATYGYSLYYIWLRPVRRAAAPAPLLHMVTACATYGYSLYYIWLQPVRRAAAPAPRALPPPAALPLRPCSAARWAFVLGVSRRAATPMHRASIRYPLSAIWRHILCLN